MPYKDIEVRRLKQRERYHLKQQEIKLYQKQYQVDNKAKISVNYRLASVKRLYNLNSEEYLQMILDQNNLCKICNKPESCKNKNGDVRPLCVDHCHTTGRVRGLLCNHCNAMLGSARDNVDTLNKAIEYLKEFT